MKFATLQNERFVIVSRDLAQAVDAGDIAPSLLAALQHWGQVLPALQGEGGFGYDPLLFIASLGKSVGQLSAAEKNSISHRALAAADLAKQMREVWHLG